MGKLNDLLALAPSPGHNGRADLVGSALEAVRQHLGMEMAYLSEFVNNQTVIRAVSAPGLEALIKTGDSHPISASYCRHIIAGRLPQLIRDTREEPLAMSMPATAAMPIGSHVSVPIRRLDGSVFGMFCCLSPHPNATLGPRDLEVMELFASIAAEQVNASLAQTLRHDAITAATRAAMEADGFTILYQPIVDLGTLTPLGFEALCRFRSTLYRSPDKWFAEAAEVGLAEALECSAASQALLACDRLTANTYVSINAAPATVVGEALTQMLAGYDLSRIVLELTEQAVVSDYDHMVRQIDELRGRGMRLAVDDAGAGYASLQHILQLGPDIIKLDMSLTRAVDTDHARMCLVEAMASFGRKTEAVIVAEGVETDAELTALRDLGVECAQGYLLGRPGTLEQAASQACSADPPIGDAP